MGTLTKKLHILKTGGTEETCNIYTTAEEVGGSPYLALEVDGAKGYVKLGSTTDANATHLRVEKDGVIYAAWKEAVTYVNVTITQSANQTIHVYTPKKSGGTDHTSSFTIPKGTSYEAEVIPADGYTAGTLNVNAGGRINSNMTFSASEAKKENTFNVTTGEDKYITRVSDNFEKGWWSCGFGTAFNPDKDIKIGSITPQEIGSFKILDLQDQGYYELNTHTGEGDDYRWLLLRANRKCILRIKGKDYNLTTSDSTGGYTTSDKPKTMGIIDGEEIEVTFTLL